MSKRAAVLLATLAAISVVNLDATASITVIIDDEAGFNAQAGANSDLLGVEDFESNLISNNASQTLPNLLSDVATNPFFPNGLNVPVEIRSTIGLRATKNFRNVVGTVLGSQNSPNPLTLTFDPTDQITAVGFNPVTPFSAAARFTIGVSLADGTSLPAFLFQPIDDLGSRHIGFLTGPNSAPIETISFGVGQVNGSSSFTNNGLDNLTVFAASQAVPEPASIFCWGGLAMLITTATRRRSATR